MGAEDEVDAMPGGAGRFVSVAPVAGVDITDSVLGEAACIVCKAAGKLNGGGEAASPAGVALTKDALRDVEQQQPFRVETTADSIVATLHCISVKLDNREHRAWNAMNRLMDHALQVPKAQTGANLGQYLQSDIFPATRGDACMLDSDALDTLEAFYGRPFFGQSTATRLSAFNCFIGTI